MKQGYGCAHNKQRAWNTHKTQEAELEEMHFLGKFETTRSVAVMFKVVLVLDWPRFREHRLPSI